MHFTWIHQLSTFCHIIFIRTHLFFPKSLKIIANFMTQKYFSMFLPQTRTFPYIVSCHRFCSPGSHF